LVGFAVGLTQHYRLSISDLSTPDSLHQAFEKTHKLLFAVACNTLIQNSSSTELDDLRPGFIQESLGAVIMVRMISIIVETAFCGHRHHDRRPLVLFVSTAE
jgi:hypothetical protein